MNSSLPPTCTDDGSDTYNLSKKIEVLSAVFFRKKTTHELNFLQVLFPIVNSLILLLKCYLKDLNPNGGLDSHDIFPLIFNKMAVILAPKLAIILCGVMAL